MEQNELKELASKLWILEQKCQKNENLSENKKQMEKLIRNLSIVDILQLSEYMEVFHCKI